MVKQKYTIDSKKLINDVKEDIELFGNNFEIFAVYALIVKNDQELEYISGYLDAQHLVREDTEDEKTYQKLLKSWQYNIANLKETKNKKKTLKQLLELLEKQDDPMRGVDY